MLEPRAREQLEAVLAQARELGFVGPGPVAAHINHSLAFANAAAGDDSAPRRFFDLGAGAGVPGLVLAVVWPGARATLLDSQRRRCAFLEAALAELAVGNRCVVVHDRAEAAARDPGLRGQFGLVVARGFGPPAVTAECGVGFLAPGGRLLVSEPPGEPSPDRWPAAGLAQLGLRVADRPDIQPSLVALALDEPVSDRWPRRTGVPAKRPLWR